MLNTERSISYRLRAFEIIKIITDLTTYMYIILWQPTPVFFPGESQGRGSLVGCRLWGRTESDTTEAT